MILLKHVYFDMHILQQQLELKHELSDIVSPLKTIENMHSQFQLKYDSYRDNNNSLILNKITVDTHRFNVYKPTVDFDFFMLHNNYIWESDYQLIRKDRKFLNQEGQYEPETDRVLFASHFYLGEEYVQHQIKVYNILDFLSEFGGLFACILVVFTLTA